jgi:hypothetical protein
MTDNSFPMSIHCDKPLQACAVRVPIDVFEGDTVGDKTLTMFFEFALICL